MKDGDPPTGVPYPTIPPIPHWMRRNKTNPEVAKCGECHRIVTQGAEGFVCTNPWCPVQARVTC